MDDMIKLLLTLIALDLGICIVILVVESKRMKREAHERDSWRWQDNKEEWEDC